MQRKKELPSEPRFEFVAKKAYDLLFELDITSFPLTAKQILDACSDFIECLSWSEARMILQSDDPFHLHATHADARTIKRRDSDLYLIIYDDCSGYYPERIKWSILHEVGHIICGHLDEFDVTSLDRGGMSREEYSTLEIEANWFVSELLMPTPVLQLLGVMQPNLIAAVFEVSCEAARKKYERAYLKEYYPTDYDNRLYRQFYQFITADIIPAIYRQTHNRFGLPKRKEFQKLCRICPSCKSYIINPKAIYCFHCGYQVEEEYDIYVPFCSHRVEEKGIVRSRIPLRYPYPNEPADFQLLFCPRCLNQEEDTSAEYCSICGSPLHNRCTAENKLLPPDCSYCPDCGARATIADVYSQAESRLQKETAWEDKISDEWLEYEHWGYIRSRIAYTANENAVSLASAMYYTRAFIDDNENLIVVADANASAAEIRDHKDLIIGCMKSYATFVPADVTAVCMQGGCL